MSSGFVTETELAEVRKKRQEEWEKVRTPDQPLERPEEEFDSRSLFERLKEQKMKKDLEYEEAHKLKNLIRGLDDDEVEFLDLVDRTKMNVEKQQQIEEQKELEEFRKRVASLQEESENKIQLETIKTINKPKAKSLNHTLTRPSQKSILSSSIVVRKRKNGETENNLVSPAKQPKQTNENDESIVAQGDKQGCKHDEKLDNDENIDKKDMEKTSTNAKDSNNLISSEVVTGNKNNQDFQSSLDKGALKCIGILPGIGRYKESSDSEISSDSEEDTEFPYGKFDLVGRTFQLRKKCRDDDDD